MGTKFRSAACPWETVFLWSVSMKFPISAEKKWTFKFWSELFYAGESGSGREITVLYSAAGAAATLNKVIGETEWQCWQGWVGLWGEHWQRRAPLKQPPGPSSARPGAFATLQWYDGGSQLTLTRKETAGSHLRPREAVSTKLQRNIPEYLPPPGSPFLHL